MPQITLPCPYCRETLTVSASEDSAVCTRCEKTFGVKDAAFRAYIAEHTVPESDCVPKDFVIKDGVLTRYIGMSLRPVIPDGVRRIGASAFIFTAIKSVGIPESVTEIDDHAFSSCKSLTALSLPSALRRIGASAFSNCEGITVLRLPESVRQVGVSAFSGCLKLESVEIPSDCTLGMWAFEDCAALREVTVGKNVHLSRSTFDGEHGRRPRIETVRGGEDYEPALFGEYYANKTGGG